MRLRNQRHPQAHLLVIVAGYEYVTLSLLAGVTLLHFHLSKQCPDSAGHYAAPKLEKPRLRGVHEREDDPLLCYTLPHVGS